MPDWQEVFDEHHRALFRFAWRLTGSAGDAEEIVQECFLALLQPGNGYNPDRAPLRTYLFGAVRNQALKRLRSREDVVGGEPATLDARSPESAASQTELGDAVARAIALLPIAQREVLILSHYEELTHAGIAQALGINVDAVKSRLYRARESLKESLAAYAPVAPKEESR